MLVGYMRVSSADECQSVDLQRDALVAAGVDERHLHQDRASGAKDDRPGLKACLADLRHGDILIVWKLDRLGRSLSHLLTIITDLKNRGVAFRSITEQMDTPPPHGEFLFNVFVHSPSDAGRRRPIGSRAKVASAGGGVLPRLCTIRRPIRLVPRIARLLLSGVGELRVDFRPAHVRCSPRKSSNEPKEKPSLDQRERSCRLPLRYSIFCSISSRSA